MRLCIAKLRARKYIIKLFLHKPPYAMGCCCCDWTFSELSFSLLRTVRWIISFVIFFVSSFPLVSPFFPSFLPLFHSYFFFMVLLWFSRCLFRPSLLRFNFNYWVLSSSSCSLHLRPPPSSMIWWKSWLCKIQYHPSHYRSGSPPRHLHRYLLPTIGRAWWLSASHGLICTEYVLYTVLDEVLPPWHSACHLAFRIFLAPSLNRRPHVFFCFSCTLFSLSWLVYANPIPRPFPCNPHVAR